MSCYVGKNADDNRENHFFLHLIEGDGTFNAAKFEKFLQNVKLVECGVEYAIVSIIGSQSGGKSTLLNHLFGTSFVEMNANDGRSQTTKGIWMANCVGIDPCTLVMDVEGTDGSERGMDDTTFEKQTTLFALASSNVVLINMWYNEIGRENGSNKPLLRIVFQVMLTLLSPRKITLIFVIRDASSQTPFETLKSRMKQDIEKIWDSVPKPQASQNSQLSEFFNVEVVALSHYELQRDQFINEVDSLFFFKVANLRMRFFNSIVPGGLAGYREGVIPASGVSVSVQTLWETIKTNKSLDLPSHKVMVATTLCDEIVNEEFDSFTKQNDWSELENDVQSGKSQGFGEKLNSLVEARLTNFNEKTVYLDEGVRNAKKKQLADKLLEFVKPKWISMLESIVSITKNSFKVDLENAWKEGIEFYEVVSEVKESLMERSYTTIKLANWETSDFKVKIHSYFANYMSYKVKELEAQHQAALEKLKIEAQHQAELDAKSKELHQAGLDAKSKEQYQSQLDSIRAQIKTEMEIAGLKADQKLLLERARAPRIPGLIEMLLGSR